MRTHNTHRPLFSLFMVEPLRQPSHRLALIMMTKTSINVIRATRQIVANVNRKTKVNPDNILLGLYA